MPQAVFVHEGQAIDVIPLSDLAAGDVVVQGELVGVARLDIKAGTLGALAVAGVFDFAKATDVSYSVGAVLYWDDDGDLVTTTTSGHKAIGKVVRAADTTDPTVRVRLSQ